MEYQKNDGVQGLMLGLHIFYTLWGQMSYVWGEALRPLSRSRVTTVEFACEMKSRDPEKTHKYLESLQTLPRNALATSASVNITIARNGISARSRPSFQSMGHAALAFDLIETLLI